MREKTDMIINKALCVIVVATSCGCAGPSQKESPTRAVVHSRTNSLQQSIERTMAEARQAVREHGLTAAAMQRIQGALKQLAQAPGLKQKANLREIHGGGAASGVLSSDGRAGLTLILARFQPGKPSPVHDHGTWAVAYVLEGQERYIQWKRLDDASDPENAKLQVDYERILNPGDSVYWFDPPHDIHSQEALREVTWELLLFGKNPQQATLHYFNTETGHVTARKPIATVGAEHTK